MNTEDTMKIINRVLEDYKINNVESVLGTIVEDLLDGSYSVDIGGKEYPALKVKNLYSFDLSKGKGVYVGYPAGDKSMLCILAPADIEIPEEEEVDINPADAETNGKIYIVDDGNSRIQVLDSSFNFLLKVDLT